MAKIQDSEEPFELHTISKPYNSPGAENSDYNIPDKTPPIRWSITKQQLPNLEPKKKHKL